MLILPLTQYNMALYLQDINKNTKGLNSMAPLVSIVVIGTVAFVSIGLLIALIMTTMGGDV